MKKILPLFSYLFHPIFIPVIACLFYFLNNENPYKHSQYEFYLILFQVIIITVFIPISFFYLLRSLGKIDSVMISNLSQRKLPLLMQVVLLLVLITKGTTYERIPPLYFYYLGGLLSTIITLILLFCNIKASIHLLGIASLLFFSIGLSFYNGNNYMYSISFFVFL